MIHNVQIEARVSENDPSEQAVGVNVFTLGQYFPAGQSRQMTAPDELLQTDYTRYISQNT